MLRSLLPKIILIFALLLAQLGGFTHGISHVLAEQNQSTDQSLPHDKLCNLCVVYAQIGGAISSSHVDFTGSASVKTFHVNHFSVVSSSRFTSFAARAPPCLA